MPLPRRVVVTGVGLISALGLTAEDTWKGVLASRCGVRPITQFDATKFSARIAAEVDGFDPLRFIEKKELKKVGRFIQFAIAASDEALTNSGLKITPDNAENVGVERTQFSDVHGLHDQLPLHRRFVPPDPEWLCRCDDLRRRRGLHHADGRGRVRRHAGAIDAQ